QHNGKIHLRPVCIPRVPYAKTRKELLPDYHKKKCGEHENDATKFNDLNLCPACRVFGWVAPKKTDALQAFAGRVQFTHAKLKDERKVEKFENLITLAILGPPQPTNTRFYLKPQNGTEPNNWPDKWEDTQCGYQKGNVLRGRKFYRHHGMELVGRTFHGLYPEMPEKNAPAKHEFERIDGKADKQNCTLAETLKAGNKFEFSIHFQSLAREELGALLWALEMESDMVHRLGLAKPLGFGSVNVEVDKIQLADVRERYAAFNYHAVDALKDAKLTKWKKRIVDDFKKAMAKLYRNDDNTFHQLDNIVDLKALLKNETPKKPVHYPRLSAIPDTEGKNFEWFVRNKKSFKGKPEKEWKHALPLAPEDNKGLPIEHTKNRSS
ncbi:MAG: TIGR03986 family CRISPR-associated RAMP protein, partial [bacterium]